MEKSVNGYYELCTEWREWEESSRRIKETGIYLKVKNNIIVDCVENPIRDSPYTPYTYTMRANYHTEDKLEKVIGKNITDFYIDSINNNKIIDAEISDFTCDEEIRKINLNTISAERFFECKSMVFNTKDRLEEHNQRVDTILQSQKMMSKIANLKGGNEDKENMSETTNIDYWGFAFQLENREEFMLVKDNRIVGAAFEYGFGEDIDIENTLKQVLNKKFKEFVTDKIIDNDEKHNWRIRKFDYHDWRYYKDYKEDNAYRLGLSNHEYAVKIASIMQANDETDVLGEILKKNDCTDGNDKQKNDGYYCLSIENYDEPSSESSKYFVEVSHGKISDCVIPYTYMSFSEKEDTKEDIEKAVGKDFKIFCHEKVTEFEEDYQLDHLRWKANRITKNDFLAEKSMILKEMYLVSEKDYQQYITSILQVKENKNTLGKTDTLRKIAGMKDRTGEK